MVETMTGAPSPELVRTVDARTGGLLGTMMTWGIAHTSIKVVLQGETARVRTSERSPTFYFYLPDAANSANRSSFEQTTTGPRKPFNPLVGFFTRRGLSLMGSRVLSVRGRRSW